MQFLRSDMLAKLIEFLLLLGIVTSVMGAPPNGQLAFRSKRRVTPTITTSTTATTTYSPATETPPPMVIQLPKKPLDRLKGLLDSVSPLELDSAVPQRPARSALFRSGLLAKASPEVRDLFSRIDFGALEQKCRERAGLQHASGILGGILGASPGAPKGPAIASAIKNQVGGISASSILCSIIGKLNSPNDFFGDFSGFLTNVLTNQ